MPTHYHIGGSTATEIAASIERAIEGGRFRDGERLPTIRALADRLAVSPTTVNTAFRLLRERGRIAGRRRGGSVVVGRVQFQSAASQPVPAGLRSLCEANPDPAFLPPLAALAADAVVEGRLYGDARESASLLEVARQRLRADDVDAEHLAIVGGTLDGIERALLAHVRPGDTIALEDPSYPPGVELAQLLGLRVVRVPIDEHGITVDGLRHALRSGARALVVVPRAQNPLGVAIDGRRAAALGRVLRDAPDLLVIEDDYLNEIAGEPLHTLARWAPRWAYVRSYAKLLGPDLRVALLAGDALTIGRVRDRQRLGYGWVSHVLQNLVASLLRDVETQRRVRRAGRIYAARRAALVTAFAQRGVAIPGTSGFAVWVPVPDETAAVARAAAAGWAIDAGARYRGAFPPGVRIAVTRLDAADAPALAHAVLGRTTAGVERTAVA